MPAIRIFGWLRTDRKVSETRLAGFSGFLGALSVLPVLPGTVISSETLGLPLPADDQASRETGRTSDD